jgi:4-amino-4-deoxy-L-arabinose transferase-like glycosyltransferase
MRIALAALVATYVGLAVLYSVSVPIYESPDEPGHVAYVAFIKGARALPDQYSGELAIPGEGHQPPLYYFLLALGASGWNVPNPSPAENPRSEWRGGHEKSIFVHGDEEVFPFEGDARALHALRLFSIPMGASTVALTYAICSEAFGRRRYLALSAAGMSAFLPQFAFLSGMVSNDNLATALSSLSIYLLIGLQRERSGSRRVALSGLAIGLSLITKLNAAFLIPVAAYALSAKSLYLKDWDPAKLARMCALLAVAVASAAGWFYARNCLLYGDPVGWGMMLSTAPPPKAGLAGLDYCLAFAGSMVYGFFGVFGWMNFPGDYNLLRLLASTFAVGLAGALASIARARRGRREFSMALCLLLSAASLFASVATVYLMTEQLPQGRLLFPAIGGICALAAFGLDELMRACRMGERSRKFALAALIVLMISANAVFLAGLRSTYSGELKLANR